MTVLMFIDCIVLKQKALKWSKKKVNKRSKMDLFKWMDSTARRVPLRFCRIIQINILNVCFHLTNNCSQIFKIQYKVPQLGLIRCQMKLAEGEITE